MRHWVHKWWAHQGDISETSSRPSDLWNSELQFLQLFVNLCSSNADISLLENNVLSSRVKSGKEHVWMLWLLHTVTLSQRPYQSSFCTFLRCRDQNLSELSINPLWKKSLPSVLNWMFADWWWQDGANRRMRQTVSLPWTSLLCLRGSVPFYRPVFPSSCDYFDNTYGGQVVLPRGLSPR